MMLLLSQNLVEPDIARGNWAKDLFIFFLGVLTPNNFKLSSSQFPPNHDMSELSLNASNAIQRKLTFFRTESSRKRKVLSR